MDNLHLQLTAVVHPSGRCCKALRPSLSSNWTLGGLTFRVILEDNLQLVEGFQVHPTEWPPPYLTCGWQVYLSDLESANVFHRDKFNVEGAELQAGVRELGYNLYNLKIYKEIYLENNNKYACKNYQQIGDFNQVYFLNFLHCGELETGTSSKSKCTLN